MKKRILSLIMLIIIFCSSTFAALINVNEYTIFVDNLEYSDLLSPALDERGRHMKDNERRLLYKYHQATNEILKASKIGLLEGYEDGTFKPTESITKGEFIKVAIVLSTNRNFDFSAIPTRIRHWSAPYVAVAEMQKVIEVGEYNDTNLNEPITRIEMICILSKIQINMKGVSQYRDAELPNYTDINNLTEEEKELLLHAARYELIDGMFDTDVLRPYDNLTRGDAAMAIMRIY